MYQVNPTENPLLCGKLEEHVKEQQKIVVALVCDKSSLKWRDTLLFRKVLHMQ